MIVIENNQVYSTTGKFVHRIGTNSYFKRCTILKSDSVDSFEEVEEIPEVDEIEIMRASTEERVKAMFFTSAIPSVINTFGLSTKESLSVKEMFPWWNKDLGEVVKGERYNYGENLWEVVKTHTTQEGWAPGIETSSLWKVVNVDNEGTEEDTIPYTPPMEIFAGKYYTQNGVKYKCIRDSGIPLSHDLSVLVGIYVVIA